VFFLFCSCFCVLAIAYVFLPLFCSLISNLFQFKVHRRGNWQKINFRRPESQISSAKESRGFLTSPWIQHFTSARKPEDVASPTLQECANQSRATISNGKKAMLCCPAISSKHYHLSNSFSYHHDLVDSNTGALNYICCFSFFFPYLQLLQHKGLEKKL